MMNYDDEIIDLDDLLSEMDAEESDGIFSDPQKACELIATLISVEKSAQQSDIFKIRQQVSLLLGLLDEDAFPGEIDAHRRLNRACSYLAQRKKLTMIDRKIVVSLGGQFSAGKSMFINSISGIGEMLPRAQEPTTSIPTYIVHGEKDQTTAMSVFGYSKALSAETMQALTHEFYNTYHISFAPFLDSIVVQSQNFSLNPIIALLDTPGYNKADSIISERANFSDKKVAFEQLHITDYLIWLVDIENGVIQQSDIEFIQKLGLDTPILIVFTKADKSSPTQIKEILAHAHDTVEAAGLPCFGITAYSSHEGKEYISEPIIPSFFDAVVGGSSHRNDVMAEVRQVEEMLETQICSAIGETSARVDALRESIQNAPNPADICSLSSLWGSEQQRLQHYKALFAQFQKQAQQFNRTLQMFLNGGVSNAQS